MDGELVNKTRTAIRRVTISQFNYRGKTQTARIETGENIIHDNVEALQTYGFATMPPKNGAMGIALSVGGDEGDPVILPVCNPANRLGGLNEGDSALYNSGGDQIILHANGTLEIQIGSSAVLSCPDGLTISTKKMFVDAEMLECSGEIKDKNGTMQEMRDQYNRHGHPRAPNPPTVLMD